MSRKFLIMLAGAVVVGAAVVFLHGKKQKTAIPADSSQRDEVKPQVPAPDGAAAASKVAALQGYLRTLSPGSPQSIEAAKNFYLEEFRNGGDTSGDGFRAFREFYDNVARECDRAFYDDKPARALLDKLANLTKDYNSDPLPKFEDLHNEAAEKIRAEYAAELHKLSEYRQYGLQYYCGEGIWYLHISMDYLLNAAAAAPANLRAYIGFYAAEHRKAIAEDAGLAITWEELRQRIIRFEDFAKEHPQLPEVKSELKRELHNLVLAYLYGTDNTRAYNLYYKYGDREIDPDLKASYERFLKENTSSSFYKTINDVYEILKRHKFKISSEQANFMTTQGYSNPRIMRLLDAKKGE